MSRGKRVGGLPDFETLLRVMLEIFYVVTDEELLAVMVKLGLAEQEAEALIARREREWSERQQSAAPDRARTSTVGPE